MKSKHRFLALLFALTGMILALLVPFYRLQINEGSYWTKEANKQHFLIAPEPFERGVFYSNPHVRKGHPGRPVPFVIDLQKYHLFADPLSIPEEVKPLIAKQLASTNTLEQLRKKSRSRKLLSSLSKEQKEEILAWWTPFAKHYKIPRNALYAVKDYQRSYPMGKLAGQILHTIQAEKDAKTKSAFPTGGLELTMNHYLQGKEGKRLLMRSPRSSFETGKIMDPPVNGSSIILTIDPYLQAIAEEELELGVQKVRAKGGWAVMMEPYSGEILALAHYPFFYPENYQSYFNDPEKIEHTKAKSVTDSYEPGSVFKPLLLALALKANQEKPFFSPEEKMATSTGIFPGRTKPVKDVRLHYFLNMNMAVQKSSNIYFAKLIEKLEELYGSDWIRDQLELVFGIGCKTAIELPGEHAGFLPHTKRHYFNGAKQWSKGTPYSLCMGHNLLMTTVQLARATAVLANGGILVAPHLVQKIMTGEESKQALHSASRRVLDSRITKQIAAAMKYVAKEGGTSMRADIPGYTQAGKSGTSAKVIDGAYSDRRYISTFIGFAPSENPAFVLVITIDEPEYGYIPGVGKNHHAGVCAAPIFREIGGKALEYLGIVPDDPEKTDWKEEVRELKKLYNEWNQG